MDGITIKQDLKWGNGNAFVKTKEYTVTLNVNRNFVYKKTNQAPLTLQYYIIEPNLQTKALLDLI